MLKFEHFRKCTPKMYPRAPLFRFLNTPLLEIFIPGARQTAHDSLSLKICLPVKQSFWDQAGIMSGRD